MTKSHLSSLSERYGTYALVTGASEGIGQSFAEELAMSGMNVVLVARRLERLNALANELEGKYKIDCHVIQADLTRPDHLNEVIQVTNKLDIGLLVCNAGFGTSGLFINSDIQTELNMLELNCQVLTQLTHHFGKKFHNKGRGGLILLSSILATQGVANSAHYAATKAYVHTLGEGLQQEWRNTGVDLLIVAPGPVETGFAKRAKMQLGNAASPEVVARQSLKALGHSQLVHPGWLAKCLNLALSTAPRAVRVKIMTAIMKSMTSH